MSKLYFLFFFLLSFYVKAQVPEPVGDQIKPIILYTPNVRPGAQELFLALSERARSTLGAHDGRRASKRPDFNKNGAQEPLLAFRR